MTAGISDIKIVFKSRFVWPGKCPAHKKFTRKMRCYCTGKKHERFSINSQSFTIISDA